MGGQTTEDGLPILTKSKNLTDEGLPIFKKKSQDDTTPPSKNGTQAGDFKAPSTKSEDYKIAEQKEKLQTEHTLVAAQNSTPAKSFAEQIDISKNRLQKIQELSPIVLSGDPTKKTSNQTFAETLIDIANHSKQKNENFKANLDNITADFQKHQKELKEKLQEIEEDVPTMGEAAGAAAKTILNKAQDIAVAGAEDPLALPKYLAKSFHQNEQAALEMIHKGYDLVDESLKADIKTPAKSLEETTKFLDGSMNMLFGFGIGATPQGATIGTLLNASPEIVQKAAGKVLEPVTTVLEAFGKDPSKYTENEKILLNLFNGIGLIVGGAIGAKILAKEKLSPEEIKTAQDKIINKPIEDIKKTQQSADIISHLSPQEQIEKIPVVEKLNNDFIEANKKAEETQGTAFEQIHKDNAKAIQEEIKNTATPKPKEATSTEGGITTPKEVAPPTPAAESKAGETKAAPIEKEVEKNKSNEKLDKGGNDVVSLQEIETHVNNIESGAAEFERFTPQEQDGFKRGGRIHEEASIITERKNRAGETQDDRNERQENDLEKYAKEKGVWHDNSADEFDAKYGKPIASGKESLVWDDGENVIKSKNTSQYRTLQEALDNITLHNTYFPETQQKVLGFGKNTEGDFQIIVEQPHIKESPRKATQSEITEYLQKKGFEKHEDGLPHNYKNDQILLRDVNPENVVLTPEGNIAVIDPIMRLNTPELNYGGKRIIPSKEFGQEVSKDFSEQEIQQAHDERNIELKSMNKVDYKTQFIHDNLKRIKRSDFEHYGDANWVKGRGRELSIKHFSNKARPLDLQAQEMSGMARVEITPQDIVDYVMDREKFPEKYKAKKEGKQKISVKELNEAVTITDADIQMLNDLHSRGFDVSNEQAIENLRGGIISDEEIDLLKNYIKSKEYETSNPATSESVPATQRVDTGGKGLEEKPAEPAGEPPAPKAKEIPASERGEQLSTKELEAEKQKAIKEGYSSLTEKINSMNKYFKTENKNIQDFSDLQKARQAFRKAGGFSSGGFEALPEFVNLVKEYIKAGYATAKDFIAQFRKDNPEVKIDDDVLEDKFNEANGSEKEVPKGEKSITGTKNAQVDTEREAMGFAPIFKETRRGNEEVWDEAMKQIDNGRDVKALEDEVAKNPRALSDVDRDLLLHRRITLRNQYNDIIKKGDEAVTKGDNALIQENKISRARIEDEIDRNDKVLRKAGSESGRSLQAIKMMADEDYSLASQIMKMKAKNGGEITEELRTRLKKYSDELEKLKKEFDDYKKTQDTKSSDNNFNKLKREQEFEARKSKRAITKEFIRAERKTILSEIEDILKEQRSTLSANPIPIKAIPAITKLAKNYIAEGITTIEGVVDAIHNDLKDKIEGLQLRDVRDAISGYEKEPQKKTKSDLQNEIQKIKQLGKLTSKLEDIESGKTPAKTTKERNKQNEEVYNLKQLVKNISIQTGMSDEINLSALKKRTRERIAELENKINKGDFSKTQRKEIKPDATLLKLQASMEKVKAKFDLEAKKIDLSNRTLTEKIMDNFVKWERAFKLSSPITIAKLTSAALTRMTLTPIEEIVGGIYSVPLKTIADKAYREKGFNVKAEAKAITQAFTTGIKDAWDVLRTGKSDLDLLYGKKMQLPPEAAEFMGQMHGALKTTAKRNEFTRSFEKRIANKMKNGVDVSDPLVQTQTAIEAYKDASRSIFLQDNFVSDSYRNWVSSIERSKEYPVAGKITSTFLNWMIPFVKVPTNIVGETGTFIAGTPLAAAKILHTTFTKGLENLTPEESDMVMRNLKKGSLGAAALLIGYFNPENLGGFYQPYEKRKKDDVKAAGAKIFGVDIPSWLLHSPLFVTMQVGATARRVKDHFVKGKEEGIGEGVWAASLGLAKETPLVSEPLRIADLFGKKQQRDYYLGELAKNNIDPLLLQEIAKMMDKGDVKKKPKTIPEHIETGIPFLRQTVPNK